MSEDRLQILKMIENGTISADDGLKLLDAVSEKKEDKTNNTRGVKWVRVVVTDDMKGKSVDIKLPSSLFKVFGTKIIKEVDSEIDINEILEMIHSGVEGELVNLTTDDGHIVSISLE